MSTRAEVIAKVKEMMDRRFNGDPKMLFDAYDLDRDGAISREELATLFEDAGVGTRVGRWAVIVPAVINELDKNHNGRVEWAEFEAVLKE